METNLKNYSPVYIGVGIGVSVGLLACLITYLAMRYQRNRALVQLKGEHEKDKKNALDAVFLQNKLDNLKAKKDFLEQLKADAVAENLKNKVEIVTEQIIE